ncbi:hypothetical protein PTQ38_26815 [Klebsiella michiganensis]|uniref:hypothetical protein n=1 Tax=Klebsiella michiganensis TaxID=1134687 RepID=UPI00287D1617|nr:hypothetical protein [Klebsiella michiganensis]MDS7862029.1 hypothetical protein [Klebsiella michiganensis]
MTSKLTREENVQAVFDLKAGYTLGLADVEILKRVARMALAAMDSEPVFTLEVSQADYKGQKLGNHFGFITLDAARKLKEGNYQLYRHAQQPVVPEKATVGEMPFLGTSEGAYVRGWNDCRAAMLQGADGKPELTVWYGAMPETNGKTNWTAILHREGQHPWEGITIDRSEYPDRVRYEADRMRHLIGELADEPDILAYDAEAHSGYVYPGNSPVIPDGYVMVPKEPTAQMYDAGDRQMTTKQVWDAMLAAAPQEAK